MKILNLLKISGVGTLVFGAFMFGTMNGFTRGMENCTKAVRLVNKTEFFTACYMENGKAKVTIPEPKADATVTQEVSEDGKRISIGISVPLDTFDIETGNKEK